MNQSKSRNCLGDDEHLPDVCWVEVAVEKSDVTRLVTRVAGFLFLISGLSKGKSSILFQVKFKAICFEDIVYFVAW